MSTPTTGARVTVAVPTWNRAGLLRQCLASVFAQTLQDFELVVLDNASTDDTADVVASFRDPRLTYVRREENIGGHANMNASFVAGTAPYVVSLFDDNYLLPTCLERKVAFLDAHPDAVLVHSAFEVRTAEGELVHARHSWAQHGSDAVESGQEFIERSLLRPGRIHISSAMFRRRLFGQEGLRTEDLPADDHALWLRLAQRGSIGFLADALDGLHMVPGLAVEVGLLRLDDGLMKPTFDGVAGARRVMYAFIDSLDVPARERRRLHRLARRGSRRLVAHMLRITVPGFRPVGAASRLLARSVRLEPSLLVEPRLAKVLLAPAGKR